MTGGGIYGTNSGSGQVKIVPNIAQPVFFSYTGAVQTYTVPLNTASITVTLAGAQGGGTGGYPPGFGARVTTTLTVTPGTTYTIMVGGQGTYGTLGAGATGGFNGGGPAPSATGGYSGGGATDIRTSATDFTTRIAVAGGGGGADANYGAAGGSGGQSGENGGTTWSCVRVATGGSQNGQYLYSGLGNQDHDGMRDFSLNLLF